LCPHCLITDPASLGACSICGRDTACYLSKTTGEPWCEACKQRWARCSRCGTGWACRDSHQRRLDPVSGRAESAGDVLELRLGLHR